MAVVAPGERHRTSGHRSSCRCRRSASPTFADYAAVRDAPESALPSKKSPAPNVKHRRRAKLVK